MCVRPIQGAQGYSEDVARFFAEADSFKFNDVHQHVLHLIPIAACKVLDVGAGSGRDAAAFAEMGHHVVAVEPTTTFREKASRIHASPRIEWLDDSLPSLTRLADRRASFDLIMLTAVWMHLDPGQRELGMMRLASLLNKGGLMIFSLRHGPVPYGRIMYDVSADETIRVAGRNGLKVILKLERQPSIALSQTNVTWTRVAFIK
jgi:protein-L-isoaspartate O-methyltransferase